ncbi:MAG: winged helix-turn-helix transcriptional regulator, partial [Nitrososphaerota archaeon]|nr:winged helix-turn-helix transcriptional regulator [Nitrososphaerota archaeon]
MTIPDETDLKILAALNLNPKYSNEEVAYIVDTSVEEVEKRIKRMIEEGIITNYGLKLRDDIMKMLPPKESLKEIERKIIFKVNEIIGLANEINRVFGTGSGIILNYAGMGVGHGILSDKSFTSKEEVFSTLGRILEEKGLGKVSIELTNSNSGKILFENLPFPKENP